MSRGALRIVKLTAPDGFYKFFYCSEYETDFDTIEGPWVTYTKQGFLEAYEKDFDNTRGWEGWSEKGGGTLAALLRSWWKEKCLVLVLRSWIAASADVNSSKILLSEQDVFSTLYEDATKNTFIRLIETEAGVVAQFKRGFLFTERLRHKKEAEAEEEEIRRIEEEIRKRKEEVRKREEEVLLLVGKVSKREEEEIRRIDEEICRIEEEIRKRKEEVLLLARRRSS